MVNDFTQKIAIRVE